MTYNLPQSLKYNLPQTTQPNVPANGMPDFSKVTTDQLSPFGKLGDILNQFMVTQQQQGQQTNFAKSILAQRFQPTMEDTSRSITQTAQSFGAPDLFKAATPQDIAVNRELAPYTAMAKIRGDVPSSVQEYQFFNNLPLNEQQRYLAMKRNPQALNLGDSIVIPSQGLSFPKGVPPQDAPSLKGEQKVAETTADAQAKAATELPRVIDNANYAKNKIKELRDHPDMPAIFGMRGMIPPMPGTGGADALARLKQITGQNFLSAYETLRGGGQITEVEGQKATEALARLDRSQDAETAKQAMDDLMSVIDIGVERAKSKASGGFQPGSEGVTGAKQAPDGNYYIPDPNRPGKYLKVVQ